MRRLVTVVAAAGIAATTALVGAPAANAVQINDPATGRTTVTTLPTVAPALLGKGVLPYAVSPGRISGATLSPLTLSFSFPISSLGSTQFSGAIPTEINHTGGIAFVKLGSFTKRIVVKDFTIDLDGGNAVGQTGQPQLIGTVTDGPGGIEDGARVALFDINLGAAAIDDSDAQVKGATLALTSAAAGALDTELGTRGFFASLVGKAIFSAKVNA